MKSFFLFCLLIITSNAYSIDCESPFGLGNFKEAMRMEPVSSSIDIYNEKCSHMLLYSLANDKDEMYEILMKDIDKVDSGMASLEKGKIEFVDERQYWQDVVQECGTKAKIVGRIEEIDAMAEDIGLMNGEFAIKYNACKAQLLSYKKGFQEIIANGGNDDFVQGEYYGKTKSGDNCEARIDQYEMIIYEPGTRREMETLILDASKVSEFHTQTFRLDSGKYKIKFNTDENGRNVPSYIFYKTKKGNESGLRKFRCSLHKY